MRSSGFCSVENFIITDVTSPAAFASTEATHSTNPQFKALPSDYAIALRGCWRIGRWYQLGHVNPYGGWIGI